MLVPPGPHVDHHERQRLPQKLDLGEARANQQQDAPEQEHVQEIRRSVSERPLLQEPTVPGQKEHVEQKVQTQVPEEEEVRQEPPELQLLRYELEVEVHRER